MAEKKGKSKQKIPDLTGKTILITGSSAGIGKEAARGLAFMGARILMACRNEVKAKAIADEIIQDSKNSNIVIYKVDLSSLESVRRCAAEVLEKEDRLDVLLNNAGIAGSGNRTVTEENFELTMVSNYYGHFLLTHLLLDLLKRSSPSRIIHVSSDGHKLARSFNVDDLNLSKGSYSQLKVYCQSKLCNVLFSHELSRYLQGTGVTSNSLHPGYVKTEIFDKQKSFLMTISGRLAVIFAKTEADGAKTSIFLASSEKVDGVTGKYYADSKVASESSTSKDKELARKLWNTSMKDVALTS